MKRTFTALAILAALSSGCGDSPTAPTPQPTQRKVGEQPTVSVERISTRSDCSGTTYVGPIRLPISVTGNNVYLSWLGNDDAIRGYELEFERLDVTNMWVFAFHDTTTTPEVKEHLRTPGTYRVRVRGLFCNDGIGPFTDWQIFSTDGEPDNTPPPAPPICLTSVGGGCYPPPCLFDCGDDPPPSEGGGDDDNPGGGDHNPPCHLHDTSNDHGGNDHNGDGHTDCGHGHN